MTFASTPAARYLDHGYLAVRGMSSLCAARIIVGLLSRQTATGTAGHIAEMRVLRGPVAHRCGAFPRRGRAGAGD